MMENQDGGSKMAEIGNDDAISASYDVIKARDIPSLRHFFLRAKFHSHSLNFLEVTDGA